MEFIEENWLVFSIVCGFVAKSIGRSFWSYFFLSLFLSPVIGFVVLLIKGKNTEKERVVTYEEVIDEVPEYNTRTHASVSSEEVKYCSACGKPVASDAKYCSYCGNEITHTL